jgi:hypothetical protein
MRFSGMGVAKPDVEAIINTIEENQEGFDDVLFLGGEPCLYLDQLLLCVAWIKFNTKLKVYVTSAMPKVLFDKQEKFHCLLNMVDGFNISAQHYDETIADKIRCTESKYDRQKFYAGLPNKDKIRINLNIVKPYLCNSIEVMNAIEHYDRMGFNSIKLSEIQHGTDQFISFEEMTKISMDSPYYYGCQSYITDVFFGIKTPVLLKRSCFLCEETLGASFMDGLKVASKFFFKPDNKYGVIYGNGELKGGWV